MDPQGDDVEEAPRVRQLAAALVDMAIAAGLSRLAGRSRGVAGATPRRPLAAALAPARLLRLLGPSSVLVREQLGSPGQRLLGLRTVDRRTGARVALWHTLALVGYRALSELALAAFRKGPSGEQREAMHRELAEIHERHAQDEDARTHALQELYRRQQGLEVHRSCIPALVVPVLGALLRRRLAPTAEVLVRRPED